MTPPKHGDTPVGSVSATTKIQELAPRLVQDQAIVAVTDEHGETIGHLTRQSVIEVLVGKNGRA